MENELLPCPFCGGTEVAVDEVEQVEAERFHTGVVCDHCDTRVEYCYTAWNEEGAVQAAIRAWNTRPDGPKAQDISGWKQLQERNE